MQTSSVEIERVCDRADDSIMETAAISVAPVDGGPELLVIFVVVKKGFFGEADKLKMKFSKAIQSNLNPLFKVFVFIFWFYEVTLCYIVLQLYLMIQITMRYNWTTK